MIVKVVVAHNEFRLGEVVEVVSWDPWTISKIKSGYFKVVTEDVQADPEPSGGPENKTGRRKTRRKADGPADPGRVEEDGTTESGAPVGVEEAESGSAPVGGDLPDGAEGHA